MPARAVWTALVVAVLAVMVLYPPWNDIWTNFEGFKLHAPLVYGALWSPPAAVFPAPRAIAVPRLLEELGVTAVVGIAGYWLLGKGRGR